MMTMTGDDDAEDDADDDDADDDSDVVVLSDTAAAERWNQSTQNRAGIFESGNWSTAQWQGEITAPLFLSLL